MLDAADVDGCGALRIVFGTVDIGPRSRMQHEIRRQPRRGRVGDVPVGPRQRTSFRIAIGERAAKLAGSARDQDAAA